MVNTQEFSKRLQKILEFYGISATAFSEKLEVNRSTISHLLSGRNKPSLEFVLKVLTEFPEVELYWLLNGVGTFPSSSTSSNSSEKQVEKKSNPSPQEKFNSDKNLPKPEKVISQISQDSKISELKKTETIQKKENDQIERIVIFYKDGSFKSYQ